MADQRRAAGASRRPQPTTARKVADTADLAGKINDVFGAVPEALAKAERSLEPAAKFARKVLWPIDMGLSAGEAVANYKDYRARGLPHDEAYVKSAGEMAVKKAGGVVGGALGAFTGGRTGGAVGSLAGPEGAALGAAIGGTVGGVKGAWDGEEAAEPYAANVLPAYRQLKQGVKMTTAEAQQFLRGLQVLRTDRYYIDRAAARRRFDRDR